MQKSKKIIILSLLLAISLCQAQKNQPLSFEFINQNITDILFIFSSHLKVPLVADSTVKGVTSFQFAGSDTQNAFTAFLSANRLFVQKTETVWYISKITVTPHSDGTISLAAYDVTPAQMIEKIAQVSGITITHDVLPAVTQSVQIQGVTVSNALEIILRPYNEYKIITEHNYLYVKREQTLLQPVVALSGSKIDIQISGGLFSVSAEKALFKEVLYAFFSNAQREYISFARSDQQIDRLFFSDKPFDTALRLILEAANAEQIYLENICYIFQSQQDDVRKKLLEKNNIWFRFDLKHIAFAAAQALIAARYPSVRLFELSNKNSFIASVAKEQEQELLAHIRLMDTPESAEVITLKYIKTEDLVKHLPPAIKREDIVLTGNNHTLFFLGSSERKERFLKELAVIDLPQQSIRYDLLIIQYQKTADYKWGISTEASTVRPGDKSLVTGALGNLLKLNFDVVTVFGYLFATKVNAALGQNQANVFADTTLYGVSGQAIKFQNTNTYRYRDTAVEPDVNVPIYTTVTREIVSGLVLEISGWVSGDGMITTNVTASVSKRGVDLSNSTGNPPPTSEKIITTQVRSRSGESVILSGLTQNDTNFVSEGLPGINRVFGSNTKTEETTEMVIYLVPHVEQDSLKKDNPIDHLALYNQLVTPLWSVLQ